MMRSAARENQRKSELRGRAIDVSTLSQRGVLQG